MASSTPASKRAVKFSSLEQRLLDLLPADGSRVDTNTLVQRYYANVAPEPLNARTIVVGRLKGIAAKAERAGLPFRIRRSERAGPHPLQFWRERA